MAEIDTEALCATQPLISEIAQQVCQEFKLDSVVWGLVGGQELLTSGSVGSITDLSTRYRIASMTKSFTAAAVLSLRDEGVLSIDLPVDEYAPELKQFVAPNPGLASLYGICYQCHLAWQLTILGPTDILMPQQKK